MSDVFHAKYRELSDEEKSLMENIKVKAAELYDLMDSVIRSEDTDTSEGPAVNGREVALAKTKLEESVMWAVKGLTK